MPLQVLKYSKQFSRQTISRSLLHWCTFWRRSINGKLYVDNAYDAVYLLARLNLLNRYVKEDRPERYLSNAAMYAFKRRAAQVLEVLIVRYKDAEVWMAGDVTYASVFGLQFSFHNLPRRPALLAFAASLRNQPREWSGFRLQPRARLVLDWARQLRADFYAEDRS